MTAAASLLKRGFAVKVYEQATALAEVGAGIQSSANAVKVLYDLGLKDALEKIVVRPQTFEFRRLDTGETMYRIPLGEAHERLNGAPSSLPSACPAASWKPSSPYGAWPKNHAVMYYLRGGTLMSFVGLVEHAHPENESWTQKRAWADLKAGFEGWHPTIQTMIDAIDRDGCYRYALNDRAPADHWSTGRDTLLGDAAHPTLPYLASEAATAIEDGAVLARCLQAYASVPEALQVYQDSRLDRTAGVVRESAGNRGLYRERRPGPVRPGGSQACSR